MAIFNPSPLIGAISGKLGGVVFLNGPAGRVVRHRPAGRGGADPSHETAAQQLVLVQRLWATISAANKQAWASFAILHPVTNRLSTTRPLSAYHAFVRYNLTALKYETNTQTTPRQIHGGRIPDTAILTATTESFSIVTTPTSYTGVMNYLLYGAMVPKSTLPKTFTNWRFLGTRSIAEFQPFTFTMPWKEHWPLPVLGQALAVRLVSHNPYYLHKQTILMPTLAVAP